jgi:hypothetical protein
LDRESATVKLVELQYDRPFRDLLAELYRERGYSIEKVAELITGRGAPISPFTVRKYLYKYGIEVRHFPTASANQDTTVPVKGVETGGR